MKMILSKPRSKMRLSVAMLLVLSVFSNVATAQSALPVTVDFLDSNSMINEFSILRKGKIQLHVVNINRNLYNISVDGKVNTFNSTPPAIFDLISAPDLSKITTGLPAVAAHSIIHNDFDALNNNAFTSSSDKGHISQYSKIDNVLTDNSTGLINRSNNIISKLKKVKDFIAQIDQLSKDGCKDFNSIDAEKSQYFTDVLTNLPLSPMNFGQFQTEVAKYFADLKIVNDRIQSEFVDLKTEFAVISNIEDKVEVNKSDELKKAALKDVAKIEGEILLLKNEFAIEKVHFETISDIIADCKTAFTKASDWQDKDFLGTLKSTYEKINRTNFEYISPTFRAGGDQLEVTVDISNKDASANNCSVISNRLNGSYYYDVYGFKVDFSTGIFANMGSGIFDQTYRLDSIAGDKDHNIIRKNDNENTVMPSLGALMHFYHKFKNGPGFGGNFGLSLTNQTKLNYHFGVSFLIGTQQRVILSAGTVLTQAQLISDQYKTDMVVNKSVTSIPTNNFYRWGSFISLTWNLTSSKKPDK